jgi:hypothetical protein
MFAERSDCAKQNVSNMRRDGKFDLENLRWVVAPNTKAKKLYIHNDELMKYLRNRPYGERPQWFENVEKGLPEDYKPDGTEEKTKKDWDTLLSETNAKKKVLELQVLQNEVAPVEDIVSLLSDLAGRIKQSMASAKPRMSPLLSAANTNHKCDQILDEEFAKILENLSGIEDYIDANTPDVPDSHLDTAK